MIALWCSLDSGAGQADRFLLTMVAELQNSGIDTGDLTTARRNGRRLPRRAIIGHILDLADATDRKIVVILDNYQATQSPALDSIVDRLLEGGSRNLTIVIGARRRPPVIAPKLAACGLVIEIGAHDLSFTSQELLENPFGEGGDAVLQDVWRRTRGWPIAIQLACIPRKTGTSHETPAGSGQLAAYVRDQLLAELTPDLRLFVMQTGLFGRFSAQLMDAASSRSDSAIMMQRLDHLWPLFTAEEAAPGWFSYSPVLAAILAALIAAEQPGQIRRLHLQASTWFAANANVLEAVHHASRAADYSRCALVIEAAGGWRLALTAGVAQMRDILCALPGSEIRRHPRLVVAQAYLAMKDGDFAEARATVEVARHLAEEQSSVASTILARDILDVDLLVQIHEAQTPGESGLVQHLALRQAVVAQDPLTCGIILCSAAVHSLALGHAGHSARLACEAARSMRRAGSLVGIFYSHLHAGLAALYLGHLTEAEASFGEAAQTASGHVQHDAGAGWLACLLRCSTSFLAGQWNDATRTAFHQARLRVEATHAWPGVLAIGLEHGVADALDREDLAGALTVVERTMAIAKRRDLELLVDQAEAYRLGVLSRQGPDRRSLQLAAVLQSRYPIGCWQRDRLVARTYAEIALSLASHHQAHHPARSLLLVEDAIACCVSIGARPAAIKSHLQRAMLLQRASRRHDAVTALVDAMELAWFDGIVIPFLMVQGLTPLLHAAQKALQAAPAAAGLLRFAALLLERITTSSLQRLNEAGLSQREREVAFELLRVQSTKAIARSLDLTEHTVKFHLSNIFAKLRVDRRANAIAALRRLDRLRS